MRIAVVREDWGDRWIGVTWSSSPRVPGPRSAVKMRWYEVRRCRAGVSSPVGARGDKQTTAAVRVGGDIRKGEYKVARARGRRRCYRIVTARSPVPPRPVRASDFLGLPLLRRRFCELSGPPRSQPFPTSKTAQLMAMPLFPAMGMVLCVPASLGR